MFNRKEALAHLIEKYTLFKEQGRLDVSSEETIRSWINEFLLIFDWDVMDTSQVLQEKVLSKKEKERLAAIGSTSIRPDYTLKVGGQKLAFLDAKSVYVDIKNDAKSAFQIKSYGWSIMAPCSFLTNFEEFAIYNCTYVPERDQRVDFGRVYLKIEDYIDNFELLERHLLRANVLNGSLSDLYSDSLKSEKGIQKLTPDLIFAEQLSHFRLSLASNILLLNNELVGNNSDLLAYLVQVIINRIVFIRICEVRRVEADGLLLEFQAKGFWSAFKDSSYNNFYERYDGPLFDRVKILQEIEVSNEIIDELINLLYYPSPYRFEVIPTKLLSDIYEIFLSRKLEIENGAVSEKLKLEYIKTNGAVSTPQFLVQDLLKRTIAEDKMTEGGIRSILDTKVLDFACGSGIFIVEVFDYIRDQLIRAFKDNPEEQYQELFYQDETFTTLTIQGRHRLISDCIYGVDIDPEAVEVARMSLSLKVIDSADFFYHYQEIGIYGNQILNQVGDNIKCGNTLVSNDVLMEYPALVKDEAALFKTNPFDWDDEESFAEIFRTNHGFDYIVGNPPYVEVKNYNVEYPYTHQYLKDKYETTQNGKVDLSVAFIERAISLLNDHGRLGLVLQKRFFKTDYGKKIREYISSNRLLHQIIDFKCTDIFKGRITYVCSLVLDNSRPEDVFFYKIEADTPRIPAALRELPRVESDSSNFTVVPSTAFNRNPWNLEDPELLRVNTVLLERLGSFGQFAKVKVGIQVLWDKAYHIRVKRINDDGTLLGDTHLEENVVIEMTACRPLLVNERFYPFCQDTTTTYVIFPYEVSLAHNIPILFDNFSREYPLAGAYLVRHKEQIVANVETWSDAREWHLFTRVQNHRAIYPKVLIPMTANDTFASITSNPLNYCDNANMFFIDVPGKSEERLYAVAGIINSTIFSVCARAIANPQQNGYFKFNKQFIEPVPFPVINFEDNHKLVSEIANVSQDIQQVQLQYIRASPHRKSSLQASLRILWNELDTKAFALYQTDSTEQDFFISKGRNINRIQILN